MALANATLTELLEQLAAGTPAPGAGTAAALAGAAAAALTEMAAAFALERGEVQEAGTVALRAEASALRGRLLELAEADLRAYRPVLDALARSRSDATRASALREALSAAAEVPLEIVIAAAGVAELAAAIARAPGNQALLGDASAALMIAEAATAAAARLVELNLGAGATDPRLQQALALARGASELRAGLADAR